MITLATKILQELLSAEIHYKGGTKASLAMLFNLVGGNKDSIKSSLTRLKREKMVENKNGEWTITINGKEFLDKFSLEKFESPFHKDSKKDLLLMFDVPEECRHYRNWLREQLIEFGYVMVQQSVWAGPSPLPKEFKDYIKKLKLNKSIRTFKLARSISLK